MDITRRDGSDVLIAETKANRCAGGIQGGREKTRRKETERKDTVEVKDGGN